MEAVSILPQQDLGVRFCSIIPRFRQVCLFKVKVLGGNCRILRNLTRETYRCYIMTSMIATAQTYICINMWVFN